MGVSDVGDAANPNDIWLIGAVVADPPVEPVPDGGGQGSLDLPGNDGDLDVGDPPTRDDLGEPVMRQAGR